jgi:hypothetical protein
MLETIKPRHRPPGRPKDTLLGKAITALRSCGFTSEQTAKLLHLDRRNQERAFKRDFSIHFPIIWEAISQVHKVALENNFITK